MRAVQLVRELTHLELRMELDHVVFDEEANKVTRVGQKQLLNVGSGVGLLVLLSHGGGKHFVDVFENFIDGLALLFFFERVVQALKRHAFQLEEDAMREVKVIFASLHDQIDQLLHVWIVPLEIERDQLGNVKLKILAHRRGQVGVDAAFCKLSHGLRLTRVQLDQHWNGVLVS